MSTFLQFFFPDFLFPFDLRVILWKIQAAKSPICERDSSGEQKIFICSFFQHLDPHGAAQMNFLLPPDQKRNSDASQSWIIWGCQEVPKFNTCLKSPFRWSNSDSPPLFSRQPSVFKQTTRYKKHIFGPVGEYQYTSNNLMAFALSSPTFHPEYPRWRRSSSTRFVDKNKRVLTIMVPHRFWFLSMFAMPRITSLVQLVLHIITLRHQNR